MNRESLSLIEIRNLMIECLSYEDNDIDSEGKTFKKYEYHGAQSDLFRLMENLAIKHNIIPNDIPQRDGAWGASGIMLHPNVTTNFDRKEIDHIYEAFHMLLNIGIISPGAIGNMGANLPYFHVTEYGLRCLSENEILPYDVDNYLASLENITGLDEWIKYYIKQALMCYNSNCYEASLIMVGLANEVLIETLIKNYKVYLARMFSSEVVNFNTSIDSERSISRKYLKFRDHLKNKSMPNDRSLRGLNAYLDELANETYLSYLRLMRNELAHPTDLRIDKITSLMVFISLIKYCERQYKIINFFMASSTV